jgi:RNA recognition motif-containing protein
MYIVGPRETSERLRSNYSDSHGPSQRGGLRGGFKGERRDKRESVFGDPAGELVVWNLSSDTTAEELGNLFEESGEVCCS